LEFLKHQEWFLFLVISVSKLLDSLKLKDLTVELLPHVQQPKTESFLPFSDVRC